MQIGFSWRALLTCVPLVLALAVPAAGGATGLSGLRIDGTWVSPGLKRALERGERQEVDCFLHLQRSPLRVIGTCGKEVLEWPIPALLPSGAAAIEIRAEHRRLVIRAGTPNELELREGAGMRRLYRLQPELLPTLEAWGWIQGRLVGRWRSEDGALLELRPDGAYTFEQEAGVYRVRGGLQSEGGAWGYLTLGEQEQQRRYLLHGEGDRLGLAELPRDMDVELPEPPRAAALPRPDGRGPDRAEPTGVGFPSGDETLEEAPGAGGSPLPPPAADAPLDPWEERQAVMPGREAGPAEAAAKAEPGRIRLSGGGEEPSPSLWFSRDAGRPVKEAAMEAPEAAEPPPAPEPILPKARFCGCSAGEGASGGLLLALGLLLTRRRSEPPA